MLPLVEPLEVVFRQEQGSRTGRNAESRMRGLVAWEQSEPTRTRHELRTPYQRRDVLYPHSTTSTERER